MLISDGINHGKLQTIIVGELKKAGLKHRLKKIIMKNVKDHKAVFGAPLTKVPSCSVICCGSTLCVPIVVSEMSSVLRNNAQMEGLFRKAGSQTRQKDIKRLLDAGGCISEDQHPIDVASVLKLYLRSLPEPLISAEVQDLLLRCRVTAGNDALKPILHTLLLLPVLHVHLLHYIMELLNFIASKHKDNLMDASNLAIVLAPSIMPLPAASNAQRLEHHVALVKIFIENSKRIGQLTDELMLQLDEDSDEFLARRKKRRSGSFNRMLSGLRKMVSGSVNTPATVREDGPWKTPVLNKSGAKRKCDSYDGLSAKTKKEISQCLPQKELSFTPKKMGFERKRLRLSMMEARSTPVINTDFRKNSETSHSSEDLLTSSEHLFNHDTIDLSPDMKKTDKDYVRISKQEYEEIKSRVSAIETRLSREFTEVIPKMQPLQQVQNVYEQTLEDVAMLHCPTSDVLARRLSRELKIRPEDQGKIIRSPSARKIGTIRRRSKENVTKIVRHKSWNVSSQSQNQNVDRFYPYVGLTRRERITQKPELLVPKVQSHDYNSSVSDNSLNNSTTKYHLRRRISLASDYNLDKTIGKTPPRRSLANNWEISTSDNSNTLDSSTKSANCVGHQYVNYRSDGTNNKSGKSPQQPKWRNAAAFFMDKTGELDSSNSSGRPSVNKIRRQNAGAVLAKAKLFESSQSDKSSENNGKIGQTGFARRPRITMQNPNRGLKNVAYVRPKIHITSEDDPPKLPARNRNVNDPNVPSKPNLPARNRNVDGLNVPSGSVVLCQTKATVETWAANRKATPIKKMVSPQGNVGKRVVSPTKTAQAPALKKNLCTPRGLRVPAPPVEARKGNTPMKAVHVSPRRRSPRYKLQRAYHH